MLANVYTSDVCDILADVVANMALKVCVENHTEISTGVYKFDACNTYYLNTSFFFEIGANKYKVVGVEINKSITYTIVSGAQISDCFNLVNPYFLVGSPTMAKMELDQLKTNLDRMPFIWLLETFTATYRGDDLTPYACNTGVSLFFFNVANREKWLNLDHRTEVVKPMKCLFDAFLSAINKHKQIGKIDSFSVTDRVDFGTYSTGKGNVSSILPECISGIEVEINFPIFDKNKCSKNKNC